MWKGHVSIQILLNVWDSPNLSVRRSHDHMVTVTFPSKLIGSIAPERCMKKR